MAKVLKRVLDKVYRLQEATNSYINDILIVDMIVSVEEVIRYQNKIFTYSEAIRTLKRTRIAL